MHMVQALAQVESTIISLFMIQTDLSIKETLWEFKPEQVFPCGIKSQVYIARLYITQTLDHISRISLVNLYHGIL